MSGTESHLELQLQTAPEPGVFVVLVQDGREAFRYGYGPDDARRLAGTLLSYADELDPAPNETSELPLPVEAIVVARKPEGVLLMFDVEHRRLDALALEPEKARELGRYLIETADDADAGDITI